MKILMDFKIKRNECDFYKSMWPGRPRAGRATRDSLRAQFLHALPRRPPRDGKGQSQQQNRITADNHNDEDMKPAVVEPPKKKFKSTGSEFAGLSLGEAQMRCPQTGTSIIFHRILLSQLKLIKLKRTCIDSVKRQ